MTTTKLANVKESAAIRPFQVNVPEEDLLDLRRLIYKQTAAFCHFFRTLPDFTWEKPDKAEALAKAAGVEPSVVVSR